MIFPGNAYMRLMPKSKIEETQTKFEDVAAGVQKF